MTERAINYRGGLYGPQGWEDLPRRSCAKTVKTVPQNGNANIPVEQPTKPVNPGVELPVMGKINW